jgi:uncharacterized protein YraI
MNTFRNIFCLKKIYYSRLFDPDYRAGDLALNVTVSAASRTKAKVITDSTDLNIRKGPGTDQPIVGKASRNQTLLY